MKAFCRTSTTPERQVYTRDASHQASRLFRFHRSNVIKPRACRLPSRSGVHSGPAVARIAAHRDARTDRLRSGPRSVRPPPNMPQQCRPSEAISWSESSLCLGWSFLHHPVGGNGQEPEAVDRLLTLRRAEAADHFANAGGVEHRLLRSQPRALHRQTQADTPAILGVALPGDISVALQSEVPSSSSR